MVDGVSAASGTCLSGQHRSERHCIECESFPFMLVVGFRVTMRFMCNVMINIVGIYGAFKYPRVSAYPIKHYH